MSQLPVVRSKRFSLANLSSLEILTERESDGERSWMIETVTAFAINKRNVISKLILLRSLMVAEVWLTLVKLLTKEGVLNQKKLLELYRLQTPELQVKQSIILHRDLAPLSYSGVNLFSEDEIVALVTQASVIADSDVDYILNTSTIAEKIPLDTLLRWCSVVSYESRMSVRSRALLLERIVALGGNHLITVEMLTNGLYEASNVAPHSGAVQIYFTLLYSFEGVRSRKGRDKARETFAGAINRMICPTVRRSSIGFFEGQKLLGWYLTNPMISQIDKDWVENEIAPHVKAYGKLYLSFIEDAKNSSAFSIQ